MDKQWLTADTVLQWAPQVQVTLESNGYATFVTADREIRCGTRALTLLDAFATPRSVRDVMAELGPRAASPEDWSDLASTVTRLYSAGVLQDEHRTAPALVEGEGYDAAPVHIRMLNDTARTTAFMDALRELVTPESVVLDIGTGTGILALAAARAGARRVYAVEASGIANVAQRMFAANGFADRITLVRGWSTRVTLPEQADLLVSEMIGSDPLRENLLEVTADAKHRLIKPHAVVIPRRLRLFGLPVSIPAAILQRHRFTDEQARLWHSHYGFDFSSLTACATAPSFRFFAAPEECSAWDALGEPFVLADLDLSCSLSTSLECRASFPATATGEMNGVVIFFETELSPRVRLSTHPSRVDSHNHWPCAVWGLTTPHPARTGEQLQVTYRYRTGNTHGAVLLEPSLGPRE